MGELRILGKSSAIMVGDVVEEELKLTWREGNLEEVALAEKTFKKYISKGWLAFGEKAGKKTQIFTLSNITNNFIKDYFDFIYFF